MRKIKFRAKNTRGCWVYGYFVVKNGKNLIVNEDGEFEVIPKTVCEYTGRRDVDGKEIYEGDLAEDLENDRVGVIIYKESWGAFGFYENCLADLKLRVIGNVYEK